MTSHFLRFALFLVITNVVRADAPITAAAIAPDGRLAVLGSQSGIEIRSWPELAQVDTLATDLVNIHDLRFSADGSTLLVAGGSPAEHGGIEVWSWLERSRKLQISAHDDVIYRVSWSPDGTRWATCSGDGRCLVFSATSDKPLVQYEGHSRAVLSIAFLDSETLASVGVDQTIRLWNSADGTHRRTLDNHVGTINDLVVRPATVEATFPAIATISEDRTVRLWQPEIGRLVRFIRLPSVPRCGVWSGDKQHLFVGCNDGQIRQIDSETMELVGETAGMCGRIHELVMDSVRERILVAGETGFRCIAFP